jgi:hypothetical protein
LNWGEKGAYRLAIFSYIFELVYFIREFQEGTHDFSGKYVYIMGPIYNSFFSTSILHRIIQHSYSSSFNIPFFFLDVKHTVGPCAFVSFMILALTVSYKQVLYPRVAAKKSS